MANIKLYGYSTSPFVRKVGCCLYYKNLPFEFVPVNPMCPEEIAFTRQTQVPVLQVDDEWRNDSTPLAQWLARNTANRAYHKTHDVQCRYLGNPG